MRTTRGKEKGRIVPLMIDPDTDAWLRRLAAEREAETGERVHPAAIAAWMLNQIRIDDEDAHGERTRH